jgi:hypothetical protein
VRIETKQTTERQQGMSNSKECFLQSIPFVAMAIVAGIGVWVLMLNIESVNPGMLTPLQAILVFVLTIVCAIGVIGGGFWAGKGIMAGLQKTA